ncbi:MAG TPA: glycoside hydrolase family 15 protein [Opitutaceae bacterium]|nr:glycoside hydrolase family 15 protein [Opitutaceae bacterium]
MNAANHNAPGAPGIAPRWTSSAKDGVGTAYHTSSRVWFTLSHGIVNEVYYPHVDSPNTRDLQFLITDGETFCHEEKRDLDHAIECPERHALLYRLTNSDRGGRYRLVKEIIGEPHSSVLLMHTRLEILDEKLRGKLRVYVLLAPHLKGTGQNNSARCQDIEGRKLLRAEREEVHLVLGSAPDFTRRSVGFVGTSDGWQDLMAHFRMDWSYEQALNGNVALTGEIDLSSGLEFVVAVAFGRSAQSASTQLLQAFATPFAQQRARYVSQWERTLAQDELSADTGDGGRLLRLSRCVLLAHEDKSFPGAFVASLSIPWGETKDDSAQGGYHLVWTRDMVQTATALLACGRAESPLRALIWLACVQEADGCMPQNSSITGEPYWQGVQMDEVAVPILLAWRLRREGALRQFDPWTLISRAARYLIAHGPVTAQERWEENSGYSPSTLASMIAALICAADFARDRKEAAEADFLVAYADWLSSHLEEWTATDRGELVKDRPRHYVRITPAAPDEAEAPADPNHAVIAIANGGGAHPARNIVGGDFLQLVRLGVRAADDPLVVASVAVIDQVLKQDLPQGPCWRRYNHDGYGQKDDGGAFDGTGVGRSWPILAGERGHYELAAGRDPKPFIASFEKFANAGGMLPEQLWDAKDLPERNLKFGGPTGSAMPLCWAHAEYLSLVRSRHDGVCFDRIEPVYRRYAQGRSEGRLEMWTFAHRPGKMRKGAGLRIILEQPARIHWSADGWTSVGDLETTASALGMHWADLPTFQLPTGARVLFTFQWRQGGRWEGRDFSVAVAESAQARGPFLDTGTSH